MSDNRIKRYEYIVRHEDYVMRRQDVYKVGMTGDIIYTNRTKIYKQRREEYFVIEILDDGNSFEDNIKKIFNHEFKLAKGCEWFEGNVAEMMIIMSIEYYNLDLAYRLNIIVNRIEITIMYLLSLDIDDFSNKSKSIKNYIIKYIVIYKDDIIMKCNETIYDTLKIKYSVNDVIEILQQHNDQQAEIRDLQRRIDDHKSNIKILQNKMRNIETIYNNESAWLLTINTNKIVGSLDNSIKIVKYLNETLEWFKYNVNKFIIVNKRHKNDNRDIYKHYIVEQDDDGALYARIFILIKHHNTIKLDCKQISKSFTKYLKIKVHIDSELISINDKSYKSIFKHICRNTEIDIISTVLQRYKYNSSTSNDSSDDSTNGI